MIHAPNCCLHFEEEGRVITFVFLKFTAGVSDYAMLPCFVYVRQNCAQATQLSVVAEAGIYDERVGSVVARVVNDWFRAKV